jgi:hypothetical protein
MQVAAGRASLLDQQRRAVCAGRLTSQQREPESGYERYADRLAEIEALLSGSWLDEPCWRLDR